MKEIKYPEEIKQEHWEYLVRKMFLAEEPLVSIGEIAKHLKCSKATARKELERKKVPTFHIGRHIAVYPSTLKRCCEGTYYNSGIPERILNDAEGHGSPI